MDELHFYDDFLYDIYLNIKDKTLYIQFASDIKPPVKIIIKKGDEENSKIEYVRRVKEN